MMYLLKRMMKATFFLRVLMSLLHCVRAEVRPGALQDGDAVPERYRWSSAARLRGRVYQHDRGEARFR